MARPTFEGKGLGASGPDLPLHNDPKEWVSSSGNTIQLCVIDAFKRAENKEDEVPAVMTVMGLSLCRRHALIVLRCFSDGYSEQVIVQDILSDQFV